MSAWPGEAVQVIVYQEGSGWVGQCLQLDVSARAETLDAVPYELQRELVEQIVSARMAARTPFANISPAPQRFWDLFLDGAPLAHPSQLEIRVAHGAIMPAPTERRIA